VVLFSVSLGIDKLCFSLNKKNLLLRTYVENDASSWVCILKICALLQNLTKKLSSNFCRLNHENKCCHKVVTFCLLNKLKRTLFWTHMKERTLFRTCVENNCILSGKYFQNYRNFMECKNNFRPTKSRICSSFLRSIRRATGMFLFRGVN
jgi:predicted nucleotidyltransferase